MPRRSASRFSHSDLERSSARRSTIVVIPSFFNSSSPCSFGCAPRYSKSLIFPGFGTPEIFSLLPYADDITDGVILAEVCCARRCGGTNKINAASRIKRTLAIVILMRARCGRMEWADSGNTQRFTEKILLFFSKCLSPMAISNTDHYL
jgi:hypothetical protein